MGNKVVTLIRGLEKYDIDLNEPVNLVCMYPCRRKQPMVIKTNEKKEDNKKENIFYT